MSIDDDTLAMANVRRVIESAFLVEPMKDSTWARIEAAIHEVHPVRSLRDWLAGLAMQGMLALDRDDVEERVASSAYSYADAMLAQRKEKTNG